MSGVNKPCVLARQSEQTTGKRIAPAVNPSLSQNAAIACVKSKKLHTGLICLPTRMSPRAFCAFLGRNFRYSPRCMQSAKELARAKIEFAQLDRVSRVSFSTIQRLDSIPERRRDVRLTLK